MAGPTAVAADKGAGSRRAEAGGRGTPDRGSSRFAGVLDLHRALGNAAFGAAVRAPETLPSSVDSVVRSAGEPLAPKVRAFMEERFGRDLGDVRVHTGPAADASAADVAAKAYTVGRHIVFRAGEYAPDTVTGRRSLGHELAHVVQQSRGGGPAPGFDAGHALEHGADRAADGVARGAGGPVAVSGGSAPGLARQTDDERERYRQAAAQGGQALARGIATLGVFGGDLQLRALEQSGPPRASTPPPGPQDPHVESMRKLKEGLEAGGMRIPESFVPAPSVSSQITAARARSDWERKQEEQRAAWEESKKLASARVAEERQRTLAVKIGRGFGQPGRTERRTALARSPVYQMQADLEREGWTQERIEEFRTSIRQRRPGESGGADEALLRDFALVGTRPWENFLPPSAEEEALIRRALKLKPDQYISQRHLDTLGQRFANDPSLRKEAKLSPEDKTTLSQFLDRSGHAKAVEDKDPIIATEGGFIGRQSRYEANLFWGASRS